MGNFACLRCEQGCKNETLFFCHSVNGAQFWLSGKPGLGNWRIWNRVQGTGNGGYLKWRIFKSRNFYILEAEYSFCKNALSLLCLLTSLSSVDIIICTNVRVLILFFLTEVLIQGWCLAWDVSPVAPTPFGFLLLFFLLFLYYKFILYFTRGAPNSNVQTLIGYIVAFEILRDLSTLTSVKHSYVLREQCKGARFVDYYRQCKQTTIIILKSTHQNLMKFGRSRHITLQSIKASK